jgi:hypothetical protein
MTAYITQRTSPQMSTTKYSRKLLRAVTYDSLMSRLTCRKRLLSEQDERHDFMTQFSDDNCCANKRSKTGNYVGKNLTG